MDPDELIEPDLDARERRLLVAGLNEWLGPAHCTEELAIGMGFAGLGDLYARSAELRQAIDERA